MPLRAISKRLMAASSSVLTKVTKCSANTLTRLKGSKYEKAKIEYEYVKVKKQQTIKVFKKTTTLQRTHRRENANGNEFALMNILMHTHTCMQICTKHFALRAAIAY